MGVVCVSSKAWGEITLLRSKLEFQLEFAVGDLCVREYSHGFSPSPKI